MISAATIKRRLFQLGNRENAKILQWFFKTGPGEYGEGDVFRGIRIPVLRKQVADYSEAGEPVLSELLHAAIHEERLLALMIMVRQFERGDAAGRARLYRFYLANTDRINNWDLVDVSAPQIVGGHLLDKSRRPLYRLARSKSLWERRIAMLATFSFIRNGEFADALAIADKLLHDREDLIHKATGWMLREVGKRDRAVLEAFLKPRCRVMPRTMLRYAIERFPEPVRQGYLRAGKTSHRN
ncbi:MAG: DNA alkylation repair protein [bacterium]